MKMVKNHVRLMFLPLASSRVKILGTKLLLEFFFSKLMHDDFILVFFIQFPLANNKVMCVMLRISHRIYVMLEFTRK